MAEVWVEGRMQSFCSSVAERQPVPHLVTGKWLSFPTGVATVGRAAWMSQPELCACWPPLRCVQYFSALKRVCPDKAFLDS